MNALRQPSPPSRCPNVVLRDAEGTPRALRDFWSIRPTVFALMRHSGCTFCRAYASVLESARPDFDAAGLSVIIILQSDVEGIRSFRDRLRLSWPCLSDPDCRAYRAFGLGRGSVVQLLGPRVWWRGFLSFMRGHAPGLPDGDGLQLGGTFGVGVDGIVYYSRPNRDASDNPAPAEIITAMTAALRGAPDPC